MSLDDRILSLLEEANPVPDPHGLDREEVDSGPEELISLAGGRADLDYAIAEPANRRGLALAAAVILAILGLVVALLRLFGPAETVDTPPSTSTSIPEQTSPLEGFWEAFTFSVLFEGGEFALISNDFVSDTGVYQLTDNMVTLTSDSASANCPTGAEAVFEVEVVDDGLQLTSVSDECPPGRGFSSGTVTLSPGQLDVLPPSALDAPRAWGSTSGAGRYSTTVFDPSFEFILPPLWSPLAPEHEFNLSIGKSGAALVFHVHNERTAEDVYRLYAEHPSVVATEAIGTSVGGALGLRFDYTSPTPNNLISIPGIGSGGTFNGPPENLFRVWVVEVDATPVTIVTGHAPDQYESSVAEVESILDSVRWDDLD